MDRRRFLTRLGGALALGGGVGAAGLGLGLSRIQPRKRLLARPGDEGRPARVKQPRHAVVVGGGLGGLSAGIELARRGMQVTLLERAPQLGGKLAGWDIEALGQKWPVEHGFHGFFAQYYNLRALLDEAGCFRDLEPAPGYPVLFADRPPETFGKTSKLFPLNLASVIAQSKNLSLLDFRNEREAIWELMRFRGDATFAKWDGVDFATFCREGGINRPMVETVFAPFAKTTLNRVERLSAAEAIRFFHFYFMGNPEGLGFEYLARDSMTAVVGPLRRLFESLGGKVRTGITARRLVREGAAITGVAIDATPQPVGVTHLSPGALPTSGWHTVTLEDGTPLHVARRQGRYVAFDGRCTHMGCPVAPHAEGGFRCPCHGGRFDEEGNVLSGPPQRPLARVPVAEQPDGSLLVGGGESRVGETVLGCDHCVVACEVKGLRRLVAASDLAEPAWEARVGSLGEADPYLVWRIWLDKAPLPTREPFYTVSGHRLTDSLALYSHFQEPFRTWARATGGSVLELHAYAIPPERLATPEQMRAVMHEELLKLLPELAGAKVLHEEYLQQDNFSRWAPGDFARRPETLTPLANLFLAGDHVKLPVPVSLMEAAVVSGRFAANGVLDREGVKGIEIEAVPEHGPLAF